MNVMIVGQKWLGVETFHLVQRLGHHVTIVSASSINDSLYRLAVDSGINAVVHNSKLSVYDVPEGTDVILCAHAWCYITNAARSKALYGALGYHPSLLPRHRGRDAIRWAIHMNEKITGGTVYWMDGKADGGAIAAQDWCHIAPNDTALTLWRRELGVMGIRLFEKVLNDLSMGNKVAVAQNESLATWEPAWTNRKLAEDTEA